MYKRQLHFNVKKFRYFLGRYDHETGEELLQQILKTFTKGLKKGQYLLYTGGDDFIFLIHEWRKKKIIDELIQRDYKGYELKDSRFFKKVLDVYKRQHIGSLPVHFCYKSFTFCLDCLFVPMI